MGSTVGNNARVHTNTVGDGNGIPIYWLNGGRIANDYADFWDGTVTTGANSPRDENGAANPLAAWTGTNDDGSTAEFANGNSRALQPGGFSVTYGRSVSGADFFDYRHITPSGVDFSLYGISPVFRVVAQPTVTLVLTPASISEDGGVSTVTATVDPASATAFTVTVAAAAVDPAQASDFTLSSNTTLSFAANATRSTGEVKITSVNNEMDAEDKTVTVTGAVSENSGVTAPAAATLTIAEDDTPVRGICDRTLAVRNAIVARVQEASDCSEVTDAHLSTINERLLIENQSIKSLRSGDFAGLTTLVGLSLDSNDLTTLPMGVFAGLSGLTRLNLSDNGLTTLPVGVFDDLTRLTELLLERNALTILPDGVFDRLASLRRLELSNNALTTLSENVFGGLTSLTHLALGFNENLTTLPDGVFAGLVNPLSTLLLESNPVDPLPLSISIEKVGDSQFKAVAPAGVPFVVNLPVSASVGGMIDGGASVITIPLGAVESAPRGVTREAGTVDAVTVDIGTPPVLPAGHSGYHLQKDSATLPLAVVARGPTLSGLSVSGGTLDPAFAPGSTSYRATVAGETVTVTATPADAADTVGYFDGSDAALADADGSADGHQVALATGANTIKVRVTAADSTAGVTYTIVVTRAPSVTVSFGAPSYEAREGGTVATVAVTLSANPERQVVIPLTKTHGGGATTDDYSGVPGNVTFESRETEQTFTVTAVNDELDDDGESVELTFGTLPDRVTAGSQPSTTVALTDDDTANSPPAIDDGAAAAQTEVPADWSLIPSGLDAGDTFRLLIVTSTRQNAEATAISSYDTVVQGDVSSTGHTDIRSYSSNFKMLGCTETVDATVHTSTRSTDTDAPIYWLNGAKVADDYADFYDSGWDSNAPKYPAGTNAPTSGVSAQTFVGCTDTGVRRTRGYLGAEFGSPSTAVSIGYPEASGFEISDAHYPKSETRRYYGLSGIFQVAAAASNNAPVFSDTTLTRNIAENTAAGEDIGDPVGATDADGDTLAYSLGGDDAASFEIVGSSGQLQTAAALDHETKSTYSVEVTADDGNGGAATIAVTVTVTDEAEQAGTPAAPTVAPDATDPTGSLAVSWEAADRNGGPAITGYDLRYRESGTTPWTGERQGVAGTSATIDGRTPSTAYDVQVRALNGETPSEWSNVGSGSTAALPAVTVSFGAPSYEAREGGTAATVAVTLSANPERQVVIPLTKTHGGGATTDDYSGVPDNVTFESGETEKTFTVTAVDDELDDDGESVELTFGTLPAGVSAGSPASTTVRLTLHGPVCTRTAQVRDMIVAAASAISCGHVTDADLAAIDSLILGFLSIDSLKAGDFDGLSSLTSLILQWNQLSTLPDGIFAGLSSVTTLNLKGNRLTTLDARVFAGMDALTILYLGDNLFSTLPARIFAGLPALNLLSLSGNKFETLPDGIFEGLARHPERIWMFGNEVTTLPISLSLEDVGFFNVQAVTPSGMPGSISVPVTVSAGGTFLDHGGESLGRERTIELRYGEVRGEIFWVQREPGSVDAVSVDFGTPLTVNIAIGEDFHLQKDSAALPLEIVARGPTLSGLSVSGGTLDPAFAPVSTSYRATVTGETVTVTPALDDETATVKFFDGNDELLADADGSADGHQVALATGANTIKVKVSVTQSNQAGLWDRSVTYTVVVTRSAAPEPPPSVTVSPTSLALTEALDDSNPGAGSVGAYTVVLGAAPTGDVTVAIGQTLADAALVLDKTSLTFTPDNWDDAQTVTVTALREIGDAEDNTYTLTHTASGGGYDGVAGDPVTVTVADVNAPTVFVLKEAALNVAEGAGRVTVTVVATTDRNRPPSRDLAVSLRTVAGTATEVGDYTIFSVYVPFEVSAFSPASNGQGGTVYRAERTQAVTIADDSEAESSETFQVKLERAPALGSLHTIGTPNEVTVTIQDDDTVNTPPAFDDGDTVTRSVAENTAAGEDIGAPVGATDDDGDTLAYSLGGDDAASFEIVGSSGQLQTAAALDHETKPSYSVVVTAADGNGGTDTIAVTISVTDVAEAAATPVAPTVAQDATDPTQSLAVSWDAPDPNGGPEITGYDLRYRESDTPPWQDGPQAVNDKSATIGSLEAGTSYDVQVRALNGETPSAWSGTGTASTWVLPAMTIAAFGSRSEAAFGVEFELTWTPALVAGQTVTVNLEVSETQNMLAAGQAGTRTVANLSSAFSASEVLVQLHDDEVDEPNSEVTVRVLPGDGYTVGAPGSGSVTVTDDDPEPVLELSVDPALIAETGSVTVSTVEVAITNGSAFSEDQTIALTLTGTATVDDDYVLADSLGATLTAPYTLTLAAGATSVAATVTAVADDDDEGLETVLIGASRGGSAVGATQELTITEDEGQIGPLAIAGLSDHAIPENTAFGPVAPMLTGARVGDVVWTLAGDDAGDFTIDPASGALSMVARDYENPQDSDGDNDYDVTVNVADGSTEPKTATASLTVTVTDVPAPAVPGPPSTTAATARSLTVTWDAPADNGATITDYDVQYRVQGTQDYMDASHSGDATGAVLTGLEPDTTYQVRVRATNGEGTSGWSNVGSGSTAALPAVTVSFGASGYEAIEGGEAAMVAVTLSADPQRAVEIPVTATPGGGATPDDYSGVPGSVTFESGGGTEKTFTVTAVDDELEDDDGESVELTFGTLPDGVSAGSPASTTVALTDNEASTVPPAQTTVTQSGGGAAWSLVGENTVVAGGTYTYTFTRTSGSRPSNEYFGFSSTALGADRFKWGTDNCTGSNYFCFAFTNHNGNYDEFTVNGTHVAANILHTTSPHILTLQVASGAPAGTSVNLGAIRNNGVPRGNPLGITVAAAANNPPAFDDGATTTRSVAENTAAGEDIGDPVGATDDDGDTLAYSLGGDDAASFDIVGSSGQLRTAAALDHETKPSYSVIVTADDGNDATDTIAVTIAVTDVAEQPARPNAPQVAVGSSTSVPVFWSEPDRNGGPEITGYDLRYRITGTEPWTGLLEGVTGTFRLIDGLTPSTSYDVQVRARNGETPSAWSASGTGAPPRRTRRRSPRTA